MGAFASCCLSGHLLQTKRNIVKGLHHYFVLIYSIFLVISNNMSCFLLTDLTWDSLPTDNKRQTDT